MKTKRLAPSARMIKILALESSADETSAAVLFGDRRRQSFSLKSNIIYSQIPQHQKTGGIVPEVAARAHLPKILPTIRLALGTAGITLAEIDAIAVTCGPGLVTSLMIGVDTAKALACALDKPIIPINHIEGHLLSAFGGKSKIQKLKSKIFPALGLTVSGGHTMLVLLKNIGTYKILGETVDDAAGEAFDKIAKILGLLYPGGPPLSRLAQQGNPAAYDLPRPMLQQKNYNFSFAGLKTSVLYLWQNLLKASPRQASSKKADLAAAAQAAIVDVLVHKTVRAARAYRAKTVLLGGGVSANSRLRATLKKRLARETTAQFLMPAWSLSTDNAGMIAIAAWFHYLAGDVAKFRKAQVNPGWRLGTWKGLRR